jgi:hypothetical protein
MTGDVTKWREYWLFNPFRHPEHDRLVKNTPYRNRTGVAGLRTRSPRPLDEGGEKIKPLEATCRRIIFLALGWLSTPVCFQTFVPLG